MSIKDKKLSLKPIKIDTSLDKSPDTSILAFSPIGSFATEQENCGNCGFMSSTKTIVHNIIVVLNNYLKLRIPQEERSFIEELNYPRCNDLINNFVTSSLLHSCLENKCSEKFVLKKIRNEDICLNIILIYIYIYYFIWNVSEKHNKTNRKMPSRVKKQNFLFNDNSIITVFYFLFNKFTDLIAIKKIFPNISLLLQNTKLNHTISTLYDILSRTPSYQVYNITFDYDERVFKIKFNNDDYDESKYISIGDIINLLNISSKQDFYTIISTHIILLDDFFGDTEVRLEFDKSDIHSLSIQNIEGCMSHIRNTWGGLYSSIIKNICKLIGIFMQQNNSDEDNIHYMYFDGMFMSNEKSETIKHNILRYNSLGINYHETLLEESRQLLRQQEEEDSESSSSRSRSRSRSRNRSKSRDSDESSKTPKGSKRKGRKCKGRKRKGKKTKSKR
jgi:hypothetical protein